MIALIVPVLYNFRGLAKLMASVDRPVLPVVINNWDVNSGVSWAWNEGIRRAIACEHAVICNDDIVLEPGTLDALIDALSDDAVLTSITNSRDCDPWEGTREGADYSCFAIKVKPFILEMGLFDENFVPAYFEDNDMDIRLRLAGRRSVQVGAARAHHEGSVTQGFHQNAPVVTGPMFLENQTYFVQKWGGTPGETTFSTPYNDPALTIKDWKPGYKERVVRPMMEEYAKLGFGYIQE